MFETFLATVFWVMMLAVFTIIAVWVVASRARSRMWGEPTEFAGTMPVAPPREREILEQKYARGEISLEDYERCLHEMTRVD